MNFPGKEVKNLALLSDSYLYKDVLAWQNINKPEGLELLLKGLALQLGNEVLSSFILHLSKGPFLCFICYGVDLLQLRPEMYQ